LFPSGVINPDRLGTDITSVRFVKSLFEGQKPVAANCHGPQMLIEAEVVNGRTLTSFPSLAKDLKNADAKWLDEAVVTDQELVTSRSPKDLADFNTKIVEEFREAKHAGQIIQSKSPNLNGFELFFF
jgi:protease I